MTVAPSQELLHALVMREMQQGIRRDGLWAQALAETNADHSKAQAVYIRLRMETLKQETTGLLVKQIKGAVAEQFRSPPDFKSSRDL
ncbi:MAG: hypothetical protein EBQ82_11830 [Betaproteobacteria bacterium]|nr:hypothetical protein [Betaproteobacteria bacterium]NBY06048.1 hypothetical protein [Betaproteobacteria bacterium]